MINPLPVVQLDAAGDALGRWWSEEPDGRILCELCPRACRLKQGDRGFCFVRVNRDGRMVLDTYGRSTGFCIDPIEKKPLNHFLPGTPVLSFGTAGCNLGCKFCQNWDISKSREVARLSDVASPDAITDAAHQHGCRSVAFTYNDPVIWAEYAIDTATACRAAGIKTVAVTAGYITPQARGEFFDAMDAANIDLKAFTEDFYFHLTGAHLDPILDTIRYVCNETDCWVELTNLIIPDANDNADEVRRMCDWVLEAVGADVPVHFTAFHPDFRMTDRPHTPHESLILAYDLARSAGLRYVYVGNVHDVARQSTFCPSCGQLLIQRDWHELGHYALNGNRCGHCDFEIAGRFDSQAGSWGRRRQPIRIANPAAGAHLAAGANPVAVQMTEETKMQNETQTQTAADQNEFDGQQRAAIHQTACELVSAAVHDMPVADVSQRLGDLTRRPIGGVYVTLKRGETLRGCCGLQGSSMSLGDALSDASHRTAKLDPRMPPIAPVELPYLNLSVSILGPPRPIGVSGDDRIEAVKVGQHGLRIRRGKNVGLLLPAVARERNWNSRQFLDAVCRKAGLPPATWRSDDATVEIFDGIDFGGPLQDQTVETVAAEPPAVTREQIEHLQAWIQGNLAAMQAGATPSYYASHVSDSAVLGIVMQVANDEQQPPASWVQWRSRDGFPLQSTLFQMSQQAAMSLSQSGPSQPRIGLLILSSAVHHGTATDADLEGVDCGRRALIVMAGRRFCVAFDPAASAEELLESALSAQAFRAETTQIYSSVCDASEPISSSQRVVVSIGPQGESAVSSRPTAVAGTFYPAADEERESLVDQLLSGLDDVQPRSVAAAMVPHAGLQYSGRIAADIWRRIKLPPNVLIIGPKHTADGVDWAVAPHDRWQLSSTASMPGAVELAQQIADAVPGMELDAAAHRREHGIEVQLPLLYRLAPQTKIAAIAMHGGNWDELQAAAGALAGWLSSLDQPPLLVISSDMNHFADEEENRRRDKLALQQLERNDPKGLLEICDEENISMCGQLPAALVLLTLQAMGRKAKYEQIAYGTSADVSGDRSRVVGYAGVLF